MVQMNRAGFTSNTIHGNEISDPFFDVKNHLTVLAITATVIIAGNLLKRIPTATPAHLVDGQHGIKVTVFRGQFSGTFLRGGESCPCGGATGVAGVVWLSRILGGTGCGVNCRTAEREFARLFLNIPQLGNQTRQQVRPAKDNFDFLALCIAANRAGGLEQVRVQLVGNFGVRCIRCKLNQQLGAITYDALRTGGHLYGVHTGIRCLHLLKHQLLGCLTFQELAILGPCVADIAGFNLQTHDELRGEPHNACCWLRLYSDHRQHSVSHLELPTQNYVTCRPVETIHRHTVHLTLNGVESNLARQVTAQVGVCGSYLQCLNCLAGVNCQRRVKIATLGVERCDAATRCAPLHPHGGRGGTIPVRRLICFRSASDTGSAILPICLT